MYYAVTAQIITHVGDYSGSRQVPLFYLHSDVQGILNAEQAQEVAKRVINPLGIIPDEDLKVLAVAVYPD